MIRRRVDDQFFLITQHDHALLAGELAAHVGNQLFERMENRRESFLTAVAQHDCGWPLHDDSPTLNPHGYPLDVFESPRDIALKVWQAGVDRMLQAGDDYASLLVSLHVLALSAYSTGTSAASFDINESRARFEINRFQHKQIEIQETLRRKLGLATDIPLQQGLAIDSHDAGELELTFHFRLLQVLDMISLCLCCTDPPVNQLRPVPTKPGGKSIPINVKRENPTTLKLSPWLFEVELLRQSIAFRRLPTQRWTDQSALRIAFESAQIGQLPLEIRPG